MGGAAGRLVGRPFLRFRPTFSLALAYRYCSRRPGTTSQVAAAGCACVGGLAHVFTVVTDLDHFAECHLCPVLLRLSHCLRCLGKNDNFVWRRGVVGDGGRRGAVLFLLSFSFLSETSETMRQTQQ